MAFVLSSIMAVVLICAFTFKLCQAIQTGEISTIGGRARPSPYTVFWSDNPGEFIWAAFIAATVLSSFWAILASLLFKAAAKPE